MLLAKEKSEYVRILDFDIENRPLSYLGQDFTTADITAIAAGWYDSDDVSVMVLTTDQNSQEGMLKWFKDLYDQADVVTGHNILRHDLRHINGALVEHGLPPLQSKLVSDTYAHLVGLTGISKSQENLSEMFGLDAPKIHMNTPRWREANRLTESGIALTAERCVGDVVQHRELRAELLARGLLRDPRKWTP